MSDKLRGIVERENALYKRWGGNIPEANAELNDLQREKINAFYSESGTVYIGKINFYDDERKALKAEKVFTLHNGGEVYNFAADYIIPVPDNNLAEMIVEWNSDGVPNSLKLIEKITQRIDEIGGIHLMWS